MRIAFKHIKARAGGAEQHDIARFGLGICRLNRFFQSGAVGHIQTAAVQIAADLRRIDADQEYAFCLADKRVAQGREVLPFAHTAQNHEERVLQTGNRGGSRADVRAFTVVDEHHAVFLADFFHAVRQALEGFDMFEQCFARQTDGFAQGDGSHNVGDVVQTLQWDVLRGNQVFIALFQTTRFAFQPKIGLVFQRKPFHLAPGAFHGAAEHVV